MNDRLEHIMNDYKPELAIIVYRGVNEISGYGEYYLESHKVNENGEILAGSPLRQDTIQQMVDVFFEDRKNSSEIKGLFTDNLLSYRPQSRGSYRLVWYRPAEVRVLHHAPQLKIPTAKAWVPAMIYVVDGDDLNVYALASDNRPTETTKLYKAPFFNVNDSGDVCLGNARVKKPADATFTNIMKYWEDLFWLSEFSHVNGTEKVKSRDLKAVWKKLLGKRPVKKWSDIDELIPYENKTVKSVL